jgi:hypothetical protein
MIAGGPLRKEKGLFPGCLNGDDLLDLVDPSEYIRGVYIEVDNAAISDVARGFNRRR